MNNRDKIIKIIKPINTGNLEIFSAASLENQIRFYFNDTQYVAAIENEGKCELKIGNVDEEENATKSMNYSISEELKSFMFFLFGCMEWIFVGYIALSCLSKMPDSILVFILVFHVGLFVISIVDVLILEFMETSFSLKSKHSAEHMIANFLKTNKRLPRSIREVKECSRFTPQCGSRKLIANDVNNFVRSLYAVSITTFACLIIMHFTDDIFINVIGIYITYILAECLLEIAITKYGILDFIIEPMTKVLTNVVQCANTTSNVKDTDIILAYFAAKLWLKNVYPEFYNEEEDVFLLK